jgi:hypothetical protein
MMLTDHKVGLKSSSKPSRLTGKENSNYFGITLTV